MRMLHIRKYYPFFKIMETSFTQYKEGKYADLDMGYISLAILRFFMEENHFRNQEVTYGQYEAFIKELLRRDFGLQLELEEERELTGFIFDKIKNDGRPFLFPYYDPVAHKKMVMRIKLIDSRLEGQTIYYSITAEAIEFYLDTKEFRDESAITVEQLLLEKMIRSRNFKGGAEVVRRINSEVFRLMAKKNEVLGILSFNVFEGMKAFEAFMENGTKWFEEEQRLFEKNSSLIRFALEKAQADERRGEYQSQYYKAMEEIFTLENELKKAIVRHGELLSACTQLQKKADELVSRSKIQALRPSFDFTKVLHSLMEQERADKLEYFVKPLLKLRINKTFSLRMLDEMLTYRPEKEEAPEKTALQQEESYFYEDEAEEQRIVHNFQIFMKILLDRLMEEKSITLKQLYEGEQGQKDFLWNQGDFYTFLVHLCQKKYYDMEQVMRDPDTFLEEELCGFLKEEGHEVYQNLKLSLSMLPQEELSGENEDIFITNVIFTLEENYGTI